jgi:hypothetical protein
MKTYQQLLLGSAVLAGCSLVLAQETNRRVEAVQGAVNSGIECLNERPRLQDTLDATRSSITRPVASSPFKSILRSPATAGASPAKPAPKLLSNFGAPASPANPTAVGQDERNPGIVGSLAPTSRTASEWWSHKSLAELDRDPSTFSNFVLPVFQAFPTPFQSRLWNVTPQPFNQQNFLMRKIHRRPTPSTNQTFWKQFIPSFGADNMLKPPGAENP